MVRKAVLRDVAIVDSKSWKAMTKGSRILWELLILFVLLLIIFAPIILRLLAAISPLVPSPLPAFVYPLKATSSSYSMVPFIGVASYESMISLNYVISMVIGWIGGISRSDNYAMQIGISNILIVPRVPGLVWSDRTALPASPTVYDPSQGYTFAIRWSGSPDQVSLNIGRRGVFSYPNGVLVKEGDYYIANLPALAAGSYPYQWFAFKGGSSSPSPLVAYEIRQAPTPISLKINGQSSDTIVSLGSVVHIESDITDDRATALPLDLWANFANLSSMYKVNTGTVHVAYVLNTSDTDQLLFGGGIYNISARSDGNANWVANSSALRLTIAYVNFTDPQANPLSGTAYTERTYQFSIACSGFVSSVFLEFDGTNHTATRDGSTCRASLDTLDASTHTYRWLANDTVGKSYSSDLVDYTVVNANVTLGLLLDSQARSKLASLNDAINAGISMDVPAPSNRTITVTDPNGIVRPEFSILYITDVPLHPIFVDVSGRLWNITVAFNGDSNHNPATITRWIAVNMTDSSAPQWSDANQSAEPPFYGGSTNVWARWSDDVLFDSVWLEHNASGVWTNISRTYSGDPSTFANFTLNLRDYGTPPNTTVGWRIWANDTSGKQNSTNTFEFQVQGDTEPPTVSNQSETDTVGPADAMIGVNDTIKLSALCSDNILVKEARLETNESGEPANISTLSLNGASAWANFTWRNEIVGLGIPVGNEPANWLKFTLSNGNTMVGPIGRETTVSWKIYCVDYSDNTVSTGEMNFAVKVFDPADTNKNGMIEPGELISKIGAWKRGELGKGALSYLMQLIGRWKAGYYRD